MKKIINALLFLGMVATCFGQSFSENGFNFSVLSTNPNEVQVTGGSDGSSPLTIPSTATDGNGIVYTVTTIGNSAYRNGANNGVVLPNTITTINFRAFRDNGGLTTITLPASVTNIGGEAFFGGGLNTIFALGTVPASISSSSFGTRSNIDLEVPAGFEQTYANAGWTGFNTVNDEIPIGTTFEVDDLRYRVTSQNPLEVEVAGRLNGIVAIAIPSSIVEPQFGETYTVTGVGFRAFRNASINSVTFASTIQRIKTEAFELNNLTTITLPAAVTTIDNEAFRDNPLTEVISQAVAAPTIESNSFINRGNIDLTVPNGSEASYVNGGWTGFFSINGTPFIGSTFSEGGFNYRINGVNPNTVELRGGGSGTDLVLPSTTTKNGISFTVTAIGLRAFRSRNLNSVVLPANVEVIGTEALEDNNLTTITLPASVTTIDTEAFRDNNILVEIISQAITAPTLGTNSIRNRGNIALTVPSGSEAAYVNGGWTGFFAVNGTPFIGSDFSVDGFNYRINGVSPNTVELRGGTVDVDAVLPTTTTKNGITFTVKTIGFRAFRSRSLNSVVLPSNVEVIGEEAFDGNNIASVILPATVTTISNEAFINNNLTQVTFNSGPETIGNSAFRGNLLTSVIIPNGTVTIGEGAFFNNQLTSISIPRSVDIIDREAFLGNQLSSITIPTGVITIGRGAFRDNNLVTVTLPNTVETIDTDAFLNNQITSINLPSNLTTLGSSVFRNNQLTSIVIPDGITEIRPQTFRNNNLQSVTLPANLQSIKSDSFRDNEITSVSFPASLVELQGFSFRNNQLTSVTIPTAISTIELNTFSDNQLTSITIPANITTIGDEAFARNPLGLITADSATPATITSSSFGTRSTINLAIIPDQQTVIDDYIAAGWTDFASINGEFQIGAQFTEGDLRYEVTQVNPNTVKVLSRVTTTQSIAIPTTVTESNSTTSFDVIAIENTAFQNTDITDVTIGDNIETIGNNAFRNTALTSIIFPASLTAIGTNAFDGTLLSDVTALGITPATIEADSFEDRESIALTVPATTEADYENAGWTGFFTINGNGIAVGNTFTENGIRYRILTLSPNTLSAIGRNGSVPNGDYIFPELLSKNGIDFTITTIGNEAFRNRGVRTISLPSTLTTIEFRGFRDNNNLLSVTIPAGVTSIASEAFFSTGLTEIISESINPATVNAGTFGNRTKTDLFIPQGTRQAYVDANWTGFKSIIEQGTVIVEPKVFLQGAALSPNTGEEDLMRDDLRVAGIIPTTSPYADALTCNANVFNTTGNDAIVDWVFVELRDATNNTTVVEGRSALLQRDGDVVDVNGGGILQFTSPLDNYFVAIKHRNHLGVMTNTAQQLDGNRVNLDFTDATNPITFGSNAQTDAGMPTNTLGMWTGNTSGDSIVQYSGTNPDAPIILSFVLNDPSNFLNFSTFVVNGYDINDLNLDGNIQYVGVSPDAPFILQNVLAHPGNFLNFSTFQIQEQLPEN